MVVILATKYIFIKNDYFTILPKLKLVLLKCTKKLSKKNIIHFFYTMYYNLAVTFILKLVYVIFVLIII